MMLYRDDYYDEDSEDQNIIEINIAKHSIGLDRNDQALLQEGEYCLL